MKTRLKNTIVGLMVGSAVAAASPAQASGSSAPDVASPRAVVLSCGQAGYQRVRGKTYVYHDCSGHGRVKYRVDCLFGQDVIFYFTYKEPGASLYQQFSCPGISEPSWVYWSIE